MSTDINIEANDNLIHEIKSDEDLKCVISDNIKLKFDETFNHPSVQQLYDVSTSYEVAQLKTHEEMIDKLLPLIKVVIDDPIAFDAVKQWQMFIFAYKEGEIEPNIFNIEDMDSRRCLLLWYYIHH